MFNVGDIITGTSEHNGYGITNSDGLMLVVGKDGENIHVYVICHNSNHLHGNWWVTNSSRKFRYETMENFIVNHPSCYKLTQEEIDFIESMIRPME